MEMTDDRSVIRRFISINIQPQWLRLMLKLPGLDPPFSAFNGTTRRTRNFAAPSAMISLTLDQVGLARLPSHSDVSTPWPRPEAERRN